MAAFGTLTRDDELPPVKLFRSLILSMVKSKNDRRFYIIVTYSIYYDYYYFLIIGLR